MGGDEISRAREARIDLGTPGAVSMDTERRGSQVVRPGSAKPLSVGSIPTRASSFLTSNLMDFGAYDLVFVCAGLLRFAHVSPAIGVGPSKLIIPGNDEKCSS